MTDIIEILAAVYQGLNQLQVVGLDNAGTLAACGDGLAAAIRALKALEQTGAAAPDAGKAEETVTDG